MNRGHFDVLMQGTKIWDQWRLDNQNTVPNLSGANLSGAYLRMANLSGAYLSGTYLSEANLSGTYLSGANLRGAYLSEANLSEANLRGANLSEANLREAYLSGANLREANLSGANLSEAYLSGANLSEANLRGANLRMANLSEANLSGANLRMANLSEANISEANLPSPATVLSAYWSNLSDETTLALMRLDASGHPDPAAFDRWANGGPCPYNNIKVQRVAHFTERRDLWSTGPAPRLYDAMAMVLDEKCPDWRGDAK